MANRPQQRYPDRRAAGRAAAADEAGPDGATRGVEDRGWRDLLLRTKDEIAKDNVGLVAAGVAFYGLLAIFPALAALVSIYGLVSDPMEVQRQLQGLSAVMPGGVQTILATEASRIAASGSGSLGFGTGLGILLALWSATKGTTAFMTAMNIAYGQRETRGFVKLNAVALGLTLFAVVFGLLAMAVTVAVPPLLAGLDLGTLPSLLISVLRWPVMAAVLMVALGVFYHFAPSRRAAPWRWASPGSIVAILLWLAVSILFSIYVRNFGSYNKTYGSLGAVAGMMMWLWLSAYVVIVGAEIDAMRERRRTARTS